MGGRLEVNHSLARPVWVDASGTIVGTQPFDKLPVNAPRAGRTEATIPSARRAIPPARFSNLSFQESLMRNSDNDILEKGLRGHAIDDLVEGWSFRITEVSSYVYQMDGADKKGHHISRYGVDIHKVIIGCILDAKRIIKIDNRKNGVGGLIPKIFPSGRKRIK
jgi:hypothetical protein